MSSKFGKKKQIATRSDNDVYPAISLLLKDTVRRPDQIAPRLQEFNLLQWQIRLKESALAENVEGQPEVPDQARLVRRLERGGFGDSMRSCVQIRGSRILQVVEQGCIKKRISVLFV